MLDGDRLQRDPAAGCENAVDRGEVSRPVLLADRLDHFDAHDGVVGPGDLAVVAQLDVDEIAYAGQLGAPDRPPLLLARQRHSGDAGASTGSTDRELTPAGTD